MTAQVIKSCPYCHKSFSNKKRQFCSRDCRNASLRKRISLVCPCCSKNFEIWPYLKRKTNFCSTACYHQATKTSQIRICRVCKKEFKATGTQIRNNFGIFCSSTCQNKTNMEKRRSISCWQCGKQIIKPPSVAKYTRFCSKNCHDTYMRDYVTRICNNCGKEFQLPTWETNKGKGMFCSRYCYVHHNGESSIEVTMRQALEKLKINFQQEVKFGRYHADFVLPERKIVIECDSYWHESEYARKRDRRKDIFLKKLGYRIFRFSDKQIKKSATSCLSIVYNHK